MIAQLLLCIVLGFGGQGRIYLVPTPGPGSELYFAVSGGARVTKVFTADDGAGGYRHTVYLELPCNATAAFAAMQAHNYCQVLSLVTKR